jgi:hypothetical protein
VDAGFAAILEIAFVGFDAFVAAGEFAISGPGDQRQSEFVTGDVTGDGRTDALLLWGIEDPEGGLGKFHKGLH